jgi:flagellar FliL protein
MGSSGGGGNKLVMILTLVNTLVTVGIVAILLISFKQQKSATSISDMRTQDEPKARGESKTGEHGEGKADAGAAKDAAKNTADLGKMVTLDQFTVNLSTPGASESKFVKVNVSLEVPTDEAEIEINAKMPQIRNVIIDLFNSKRPADLSNAEGRDYLKEEIRNALNGFLVRGKVKGVFFTNFALSG